MPSIQTAVKIWTRSILIAFGLAFASNVQATSQIDSLKTLLASANSDSTKAGIYIKLTSLVINDDLKLAEEYARKGLEISKRINSTKIQAQAYRYIGLSLNRQSDYGGAIEYYTKGLELFNSLGDLENIARMYSNMGSVYESISNDMKALELNLKAQKYAEQIPDTIISAERLIAALNNIGVIYAKKPQTRQKALDIFQKALTQASKIKNLELESKFCANIGEIYFLLDQYEKALEYYNISIQKYNGIESLPYVLLSMGKVYTEQKNYQKAESMQRQALSIAEKANSKRDMTSALNALGNTLFLQNRLDESIQMYERAVVLGDSLGILEDLFDTYSGLSKVHSSKGDFKKAFEYNVLESEISDSLYNIDYRQKLESFHFDEQIKEKDHKLSLETKERELAQERTQGQRRVKIAFQIGLVLVLIILFILFRNFRNKVRINKILDSQKAEIETLLLNILPEETAEELKKTGKAKTKSFDSISVLFTDFKNFTQASEILSAEELVEEINQCYSEFDRIVTKHGLEKIKTIGDSYMCAGGIPTPCEDHAERMVKAALEMQAFIETNKENRIKSNLPYFELRLGIHSGPVVAGVVGTKKFAYDIWGDTVNTASRMESSGAVGKVNISEATYELIKDKFKCTPRGKVAAKNKGEIEMYFVEGAFA